MKLSRFSFLAEVVYAAQFHSKLRLKPKELRNVIKDVYDINVKHYFTNKKFNSNDTLLSFIAVILIIRFQNDHDVIPEPYHRNRSPFTKGDRLFVSHFSDN